MLRVFFLSWLWLFIFVSHTTAPGWQHLLLKHSAPPTHTVLPLNPALALDLIATSLESGLSVEKALELQAETSDEPHKSELFQAINSLKLGLPWEQAWKHCEGNVQELARELAVTTTGISCVNILYSRAKNYRKQLIHEQAEKIERLSINLLLPLGLLTLPSFIAIGIIPTIMSLIFTLAQP